MPGNSSLTKEGHPWIDCSDRSLQGTILCAGFKRSRTILPQTKISNGGGAKPFLHQAGGLSNHKRPLLSINMDHGGDNNDDGDDENGGYVLKPLRRDHRGYLEIAFYEAIAASQWEETGDSHTNKWITFIQRVLLGDVDDYETFIKEVDFIKHLSIFTPNYYGVICRNATNDPSSSSWLNSNIENDGASKWQEEFDTEEIPPNSYLILRNATQGFAKPCVIDLKMGVQTYEPTASIDKQLRERQKYPQQLKFGFRITGMRVYDPHHEDADDSGYRIFSKHYGRHLKTQQDVMDALRIFVSSKTRSKLEQSHSQTSRMLGDLISKLYQLELCFQKNKELSFYASSILIIREGDLTKGNFDCCLKTIDFGHVCRKTGGDQGYIHGIQTLRTILEELLQEET